MNIADKTKLTLWLAENKESLHGKRPVYIDRLATKALNIKIARSTLTVICREIGIRKPVPKSLAKQLKLPYDVEVKLAYLIRRVDELEARVSQLEKSELEGK